MTRVDTTREQLVRFVRSAPFQPFSLNMENGDQVIIEHPENLAFDPTPNGRPDFSAITSKLWYQSHLDAVTSVAKIDRGQFTSERVG